MNKTIVGIFIIFSFLFYTTAGVSADTSTSTSPTTTTTANVIPLQQLTMIGRLAQSLGLSKGEIQAELDSGKTLLQVAEEHGMPERNFNSRILGANFNLLSSSKTKVVKKPVKIIKKVTKKVLKKIIKK